MVSKVLLSTVLGLCCKEAEQRTPTWPRLAELEPLRIGFLKGPTYYLLPYKAGRAAIHLLKSVFVA